MVRQEILPIREDGLMRKKWSVEECGRLTDVGILMPGQYELIGGEIVFKVTQDQLHIITVTCIAAVLSAIFGGRSLIYQANIGIGEQDEFNDPEPDIAVVRGTIRDYRDRRPVPSTDILLVVEAANTSLPSDTGVKAMLYARHGLPEYWVVSIINRQLIVHRDPSQNGYQNIQTYEATESISPLALPQSTIQVSDLLP